MKLNQISDPITAVENYFSAEAVPSQLEEENATVVARSILQSLKSASLETRRGALRAMTLTFHSFHESMRRKLLKAAICQSSQVLNWKDAVLGVYAHNPFQVTFPLLHYSNDLKLPISLDQRFSIKSDQEIGAIYGSTFATNKPKLLNDQGHHLLDAAYGLTCYNVSSHFTGFALALGDGVGGHYGDVHQDRKIGRAAHFGTKACVRLLSAYPTAETLNRNAIEDVVQSVAQEMQLKASGEGSTLVACRAFPERDGFRVIGFNIGDGMLVGWNPHRKTFDQFLSAHLTTAGPAFLPEAYRSFEIHAFDAFVPEGTFLFLLSDGVYEFLPRIDEDKVGEKGVKYRESRLKEIEALLLPLPLDASLELYLKAMITRNLRAMEGVQKEKSGDGEVQIGDDALLLGCHLMKKGSLKSGCQVM